MRIALSPDSLSTVARSAPGWCEMMKNAFNRYCSRCLRTRRFYEVEDHYVCERCRKLLVKVHRQEGAAPGR